MLTQLKRLFEPRLSLMQFIKIAALNVQEKDRLKRDVKRKGFGTIAQYTIKHGKGDCQVDAFGLGKHSPYCTLPHVSSKDLWRDVPQGFVRRSINVTLHSTIKEIEKDFADIIRG